MAFEGTKSREAHICRAKGLEWRLRNTNASNRKARAFFEQAIACDPGYALAYSDLARAYYQRRGQGWTNSDSHSLDRALRTAHKAMALDPAVAPQALIVVALVETWRRRYERALAAVETGVAMAPAAAECHALLGYVRTWNGEPDTAAKHVRKAMRLDPDYPFLFDFFLGHAQFGARRYKAAARHLGEGVAGNGNYVPGRLFLAATYGHLGRAVEGRAEIAACRRINRNFSETWLERIVAYRKAADHRHLIRGLKKAGLGQREAR